MSSVVPRRMNRSELVRSSPSSCSDWTARLLPLHAPKAISSEMTSAIDARSASTTERHGASLRTWYQERKRRPHNQRHQRRQDAHRVVVARAEFQPWIGEHGMNGDKLRKDISGNSQAADNDHGRRTKPSDGAQARCIREQRYSGQRNDPGGVVLQPVHAGDLEQLRPVVIRHQHGNGERCHDQADREQQRRHPQVGT